jgi:hypothetical protein
LILGYIPWEEIIPLRNPYNVAYALCEMFTIANGLDYANYSGQRPDPILDTPYMDCKLFAYFNSLVEHGVNSGVTLSYFQQQVFFYFVLSTNHHAYEY